MMAKAVGLIFSLFDVASAGHVPFGTPQYIQCILQGFTGVLLCVPFIVATLIAEVLFEQFLIRNAV